jgi:hypothetical protein
MYHHPDSGRNPVSPSPPTASKLHNLETKFVVCLNNQDYPASLEVRKIYQIIPDNRAGEHQLIRVIDESGEDYLYPVSCFLPIALPQAVAAVFA